LAPRSSSIFGRASGNGTLGGGGAFCATDSTGGTGVGFAAGTGRVAAGF
jgi:hypothetical protein